MRKKSRTQRITPEAIDCWRRGDSAGLHEALGLAPFEWSPMPFGWYSLPEKPRGDGTVMDRGWGNKALGWAGVKALQDELYAIAGEPGAES